jgi:hypothetical protein
MKRWPLPWEPEFWQGDGESWPSPAVLALALFGPVAVLLAWLLGWNR